MPFYGDPTIYPTGFALVDDALPPNASNINVAPTALGHRTAYLKAKLDFVTPQVTALPLLNLRGFVALGTPRAAVYSDAERSWLVSGDAGTVRRSRDFGGSFAATETSAVVAGTEETGGIDVDPSGNAIVAMNVTAKKFLAYNAATQTWTSGTLPGPWGASGVVTSRVVYNPIVGLWCLTHCDTFNSRTLTSTDRASWTNRVQWSAAGNPRALMRVGVNKSTGRQVFAGVDSLGAGTLDIATSDDGGVSFTDRASLTTTIASPTKLEVAYSPTRDEWLVTIGEVSGTPSSEVWSSTDGGVTWTKIATLATACLTKPAPFDTRWICGAATGPGGNVTELVFSEDGGASWKYAGFGGSSGAVRGVVAGGGGALLVDSLLGVAATIRTTPQAVAVT